MLVVGLVNLHPVSYKLQNGRYIPTGGTQTIFELLRDFGLSAVGVGLVGIVFEVFNRRAAEAATTRLLRENTEQLGNSVAAQTTAVILRDRRFIDEVLTVEQRQDLIESILMGRLDPSAKQLAQRTATALSGPTKLEDYRVRYTALDAADGDPHAELTISLIRNTPPLKDFVFKFYVLTSEDTRKLEYESEVFWWRHWLAPSGAEDLATTRNNFRVVKVSVNGEQLPQVTIDDDGADFVWFKTTYTYASSSTGKYQVETTLRLPPPLEGSYVYFEPRYLCKQVTIECNMTHSAYRVVPVETLRAEGVRIEDEKDALGKIITSRVATPAWVLPSAAVAFVFYSATKPYNLPSTTATGQPAQADSVGNTTTPIDGKGAGMNQAQEQEVKPVEHTGESDLTKEKQVESTSHADDAGGGGGGGGH